MKKILLIILGLFLSYQAHAQPPAEQPTQPTEASEPIPDLSETKNMDTVLSEKVQAAIHENTLLKGQAVSAASVDGVITLQGSVESTEQENEAINTAKSVPGVVDVTSQLTIKAVNNGP